MGSGIKIIEATSTCEAERQTISATVSRQDKSAILRLTWSGKPSPDPATALRLLFSSFEGIEVNCDEGVLYKEQGNSEADVVHPVKKGLLFDGGIDAFYSLHKGYDDLTSLVFLNGLYGDEEREIKSRHSLRSELTRALYQSTEADKEFIQLDINLSEVLDALDIPFIHHPGLLHAGISGVLAGEISTMVVPVTHQPGEEITRPGDRVELDFNQLTLADKQLAIARDSRLMNSLRVCWEVASRTYNCGRCRRCSRAIPSRRLVESLRRREANLNMSRRRILKPGTADRHAPGIRNTPT